MAGKHTTVDHLVLNESIGIRIRDARILFRLTNEKERIEIEPAQALQPRTPYFTQSLTRKKAILKHFAQVLKSGVGVEKVTSISGMRFSKSMLEESICPCCL